MRFAFCGYDYSLDIAQTLIAEGHSLLSLFTFPCDQIFAFNLKTYELADTLSIPITDKPLSEGHLSNLIESGCEAILVAGYPRKIPPIDPDLAYGMNIHPALLPRARGITPLPYILLEEPSAAGFTIHKLSPEYDSGDILYQEALSINEETDVEILSSRIALRSRIAISRVFSNLPEYWKNATPQNENKTGDYPPVSLKMRTLDWNDTASSLAAKSRAFGRYGVIAEIQNNDGARQKLGIFQFSTWQEKHAYTHGDLLRSSPREIVIAVKDGFALLKDFQVIG